MDVKSYVEARSLINDGDVVFIRNKNTIVAKAIRFFTKSKYSHVGFAFWIETAGRKRLMMVEAQGKANRRVVNMSFYAGVELDVIAAPRDWCEIGNVALGRLGQVEYSWLEAAYVGIREFLLKYFQIEIPRKDFPGEICSEYIARILKLPEKHISPQLLWEQLIKLKCEEKLHVR